MKISKEVFKVLKRVLIVFFIISAVYTILDLYVPLKRWIYGDQLTFSDILESINFQRHFLYIFITSMVVGSSWYYSDNQQGAK